MTTPDEHIDRLERLFEGVWNGSDPAVAADLVADDYYVHDRELAAELRGPELYRALASGTREVFPDATFAIEDAVADGDRVALRWTMTGTHEGPLFDVAATGREVWLPAVEMNRFEEGLLAETWSQSDMLGVARQIGAFGLDADER